MKSSRPIKDVCARKCRGPNSYYLGSAESPTSDSFSVWLKSSRSDGVASPPCSPQVGSALRPPSLYGRRLCRTVPACCTGTTCQNIRALSNVRGREYFHLFSGKNQKPNSAHKCPITSVQIRTKSQKLSEFSYITFEPLNRGRPRFWAKTLKITYFSHGECVGGGGGQETQSPPASYRVWGGAGER